MRSRTKRKLTFLLLGIALAATALVYGYRQYRALRAAPAKIVDALPQGANIVLGAVQHTAVRDGRKEWILEASSAQYAKKTRKAVFSDVNVTFFMDTGEEVGLEGQEGSIDTASNDMRVTGNVRVKKGDYTLLTERIDYDHLTRQIASQAPVRILGPGFELQAQAMQVDLTKETAVFTGAVEGQIDAANHMLP
jgi:lipopolysaccharide export system protein LptC